MGLLDGNLDDPQKQMLMALAAGLLSGSGRTNKNFAADLGSAIPQGLLALNSGRALQSRERDADQQRQMHAMQMAQMQHQGAQQQRIDALGPQFMKQATPQQFAPTDQETPSIPAQPGGMDWKGYSNALAGIDPAKGMALQAQLAAINQKNIKEVAPGGSLIDIGTGKPIFAAPPKLPDGMVAGPNGPQFMPAYLSGKKEIATAGRPQVTVDNRQENEFEKSIGKKMADNYDTILQSGQSSQAKLRDIQRFESIVAKVPTGKLEPFKAEIGRLANGLGVKVDTEKLGFQEALEALSNQFALTLRNPSGGAGMPGAMSDKDREFLVSMVPGLAKTPQGNAIVIEAFKRTAQRDAEISQLARDYKKKNGKFDEGFYEVLAQTFGGKDLLGDLYAQASQMGVQNAPSGWGQLKVH